MGAIRYLKGDATCPQASGLKVICHVCNDRGGWGKGFVLALSRRWKEPEQAYRAWHRDRNRNDFALGAVQFIQVEPYVWVANMVAQHGVRRGSGAPPIRYEALARCLEKVAAWAVEQGASLHMPRIGCGLAGGSWARIEPLLVSVCEQGLDVTVYDFE
jgi:O-acetyl-ADP-ribose deacetylase (regulator of RNase III)